MSQSATAAAASASASASAASAPSSSGLSLRLRGSASRGHANHGWLNSYHTFSFASYFDPKFNRFHSLRVINEDRVSGGQGFGTHPHSNFEIFSYIVSGALSHKDSMGNTEVLNRGEVQFTSAGTGIQHSEFNASQKDFVHFLQIWCKPDKHNLKPRYSTMTFPDAEKEGKLRLIIAPESFKSSAAGATFIPINQDFVMYASILRNGQSVSHSVAPGRALYVHLIQDVSGFESEKGKVALQVNGLKLKSGDGLFVERKTTSTGEETVTIKADSEEGVKNEFVIFDVKTEAAGSTAQEDD
jgi:hypothetical protein